MARTLDRAAHTIRRDAFLDAAERLIRTCGYEEMTVQDVLDELGASKGAFYHYFGSKEALLEAVIERMTEAALAVVRPIAADAELPAAEKLQLLFSTAGRWKTERSDLLLSVLRSWYSDENELVRARVARAGSTRLSPIFADVIREGVSQGTLDATSPDDAAVVLMALFNGSSDAIGRLVLERQAGLVSFEDAQRFVGAYAEAVERILGLRPHSFVLIDDASMRVWFG